MPKAIAINAVKEWTLKLPDSPAEEWLGNMKFHNNSWEIKRLKTLEAEIKSITAKEKRRPVVLYIGAYKGDMAALLSKMGADLILVESTPAFWTLIQETWELNPDLPKPLALFSGLISQESKGLDGLDLKQWPTRKAEYIEGKVGFTHLAESKDDPTFPQISIDDLVKRTGIVPDIITMDIEGSEGIAIKGGLETLKKYHPYLLISIHPEFMFHNHGTYERELRDDIEHNGYNKGVEIDYDHEHHVVFTEATNG